jgi:hypothetical protein
LSHGGNVKAGHDLEENWERAEKARPRTARRPWTAIASERTRHEREKLADEISRIPDEALRANLRCTMGELFRFLEDDLERGSAGADRSESVNASAWPTTQGG